MAKFRKFLLPMVRVGGIGERGQETFLDLERGTSVVYLGNLDLDEAQLLLLHPSAAAFPSAFPLTDLCSPGQDFQKYTKG